MRLSNEKNWEFVDAGDVLLRYVRAANVAAVTATISRRILPLILDEGLRRCAVVIEERGYWACSGPCEVASRREVAVDELGGRAVRVRISIGITKLTVRSLEHTGRNWDDEVAVKVASNAILHKALSGHRVLTTAWASVRRNVSGRQGSC